MFIVVASIFIILEICSILCLIISIKQRKESQKTKYSTLSALLCAIATLINFIDFHIPVPIITPLNSGSTTYIYDTEVTITNDSTLFTAYYTLDGSDPKDVNSYIYEKPILVSEATTVAVRSKFLLWWSDVVVMDYKFEKLPINNNTLPNIHNKQANLIENTPTPELQTTKPESSISPSISPVTESPTPEAQTPSPSPTQTSTPVQTKEPTNMSEGLDVSEAHNLLTYVNQYRIDAGVSELVWNSDLEQEAQNLATSFASGDAVSGFSVSYPIGRQCNGIESAQRAVSEWMTGNAYIPSEADALLHTDFTQMGGALYYLPNGNEFGYHYFWVICLS